ncbi:kynureninase [Bacillus mesophilus]|uniref:Kynureninase n=1 Tax=Bacillus mesophilus TaxID=1808955 RepID=A0A6M0Q2U9_9BACI|nr:kynureninase [Bacillus mesophilus]MBM7659583.1 kynureninase [Bacillus mesophilus]NEY70453.1 kynureninase [Bacillus mesophilus]
MQYTLDFAKDLDKQDLLSTYRNEFYIKEGIIYLDGNSLGLLSKRAEDSVKNMLESWKEHAIEGWMNGENPWFFLSENLGSKMAGLVGAKENEVIVTGSTTINLHQLIASFYNPSTGRTKIIADELTFPSDIYAMKSQIKLKGLSPEEHLVQVKSNDGYLLNEDDLIAAMDENTSLVILSSVLYRSGQLLDMKKLVEAAHERGILIGFDLAHSIGVIPHDFANIQPDFAFWCNYKYVNSGPGSVGGLYVNEKHFGVEPGISGWFSSKKDKQFDMEHELNYEHHAGAFQVGTPHILSIAPIIGSLQIFEEAGIDKIRRKSLQLTNFLMMLIDSELTNLDFTIINPRVDEKRGGHVCLHHSEAASICKALKAHGIIPDYREPSLIRLAPVSFYTSYEEVWRAVQVLKEIMVQGDYKKFKNTRNVIA